MGVNLWIYTFGSMLLTAAIITNTYHEKEQFYPTMVHLTKSKPCLMVMGNLAIVLTVLFGHGIKRLFVGQLREIEVEHLTDRIWGTVTDTLLAMTIFRNEFNTAFITLFTTLLFLKIFHWISQDRVEYIQHTPVSTMTSFRIFALMVLLTLADSSLLYYAANVTLAKGPSMMLLFGFEFLLLLSSVISTMIKFIINVIDSRRETTWEAKGAILLYLEFVTDIFQLVVYLIFFAIIMMHYGLPLHIVRNVYLTFRSMKQCIESVVRYRKATSNMNERFPDVANVDQMCIVCREDMVQGKRLPCGHILHFHCLLGWLQRQQNCPICRTSVFDTPTATTTTPPPDAPAGPAAAPHPPHPRPHLRPHPRSHHQRQTTENNYYNPDYGTRNNNNNATSSSSSSSSSSSAASPDGYYDSYSSSSMSSNMELEGQLQILQVQVMSLQEEVTNLKQILDRHGLLQQSMSTTPVSGSGSVSPSSSDASDSTLDELRKRRLLRFSNNNNNNNA